MVTTAGDSVTTRTDATPTVSRAAAAVEIQYVDGAAVEDDEDDGGNGDGNAIGRAMNRRKTREKA
jgi:hypothetical protein